jgi:NAD(P)-dependent dehydrogenase (short-subunit alcohol dehydrogenase family)
MWRAILAGTGARTPPRTGEDLMIVERIRLDGRVIVVSGAGGGGIGTMTARAMAEAGATVVGVDIADEPLALATAALEADGLPFTPVIADVTTDAGIESVVAIARERHGGVHGLVNVVGGALTPHWAPSLDFTRARWQEQIVLNLDTAMFMSQAVAREIVRQGSGGSIVCLSSTSGIGAAPFHVAYGAAKGALVSMVRTLALEWADHGIRVNAIAPGTIRTPRSGPESDPDLDRRGVPMARRGEPDEIAAAALFLVSDLASYVTGQCLPVDGGTSAKHVHLGDDNTPIFVRNPDLIAQMKGDTGSATR